MDRNLIYERLKALGNEADQQLYRDISQAFEEVIRYDQEALDALRRELKEELHDEAQRYYLYGSVIQAGDESIVNDFLFPMCREQEKEGACTVFCEGTLSEVGELFTGSHAVVITAEEGTAEAEAFFFPCVRYGEEVEKLKKVYYDNGLYWRKPFLPYLGRFADMECSLLKELGGIREIRLADGRFPLKPGLLPVWNVGRIKRKCTVFPIPAIDEQYYRHSLKLPFARDGYAVVMEPSVRRIYYHGEELVLVTEDKGPKEFELYRIASKREVNVPHYELTSNARNMRFIDRQADHAVRRLMTLAEISRMVTSYAALADYKLTGVRDDEEGVLVLQLKAPKEDFLTVDRAAFLTGEVQEYFPQFKVRCEVQV